LSSNYPRCQQFNLATRYVEVAPLLRMLLVRLVLSSWRPPSATLPAYGRTNRSASSATAEALPIDLSDAMEALLEFDDSRHRAPLGQLRLSFSTMACAILISPRNQLGESVKRAIGVFIAVFMAWGLWKSLASALLYIDVSVRPSSEALFFFGHLLTRFISSSATRSTSYSN
jgi:hypothetical protein